MSIEYRWSILIGLLAIALVCYTSGFANGTKLFIGLGVIFEIAFWFGLFSSSDNGKE